MRGDRLPGPGPSMRPARRQMLRGTGLLAAAQFVGQARLAGIVPIAGAALLAPRPAAARDLPALVARARPSIVAIGTFERLRNPQFRFTGTGFAVGDGNTVATCAHVLPTLDPATQERLVLAAPAPGGGVRVSSLTLQASNREVDLAVLRFDGPALPALQLSTPDAAAEGVEVVLIGFPIGAALGLYPATHRGLVAAIAPMAIPSRNSSGLDAGAVNRLRGRPIEILQLDATAYPSNSGSPLLDVRDGRVLGVVNMVTVKGSRENAISAPSGISYAVPSSNLAALLAAR